MNNKGFTLIEIIVVIAILGIIGVVFTVSLTNTLKKTQESECTDFISEVEEAACMYATLYKKDSNGNIIYDRNGNKELNCAPNTACSFTVWELYTNGMIDSNVNKCTNNNITSSTTAKVNITYSSGERICTYVE